MIGGLQYCDSSQGHHVEETMGAFKDFEPELRRLVENFDSDFCEVDALAYDKLDEVVARSDEEFDEESIARIRSLIGQVTEARGKVSSLYVDEAGLMLRWDIDGWNFTAAALPESGSTTIQAVRFEPTSIRIVFVPSDFSTAISEIASSLPRV